MPMTSEAIDKGAGREKSSSNRLDQYIKKLKLRRSMKKKFEAEKMRYRDELRENMVDAPFVPEKFGDRDSLREISRSGLRHGVVSIALFNDKVMVYACSGTAVRHRHGNIQDHHNIFVTSARLARKFEDNRTRDDNLRIEVRTCRNVVLHGFLGLYDDNIAIVTSFSLNVVHTMDTSKPVRLPRVTYHKKVFAFGCANDDALMAAQCSLPVFKDKGLVSVNCKITESGLGGPVIYLSPDGSGHIAGLVIGICEDKITFLPKKELHQWLKRLLLITSKTCHFRGYSLPEGVKTVIPSGFMVQSKILQSLGYPLPPPLVFELNGRLVGRFEELFGQFHYWEGYPWDISYDYGPNPIWDQLGKNLAQEISRSVVSIASFKGNTRCFACTGLLIKGVRCPLVLTSASLVRIQTGDLEGKLDDGLRIEVFLPPKYSVDGKLQLYDDTYNIAVFSLEQDFATAISPVDIMSACGSSNDKSVVAIGRAPKRSHGLLMASMGEVKGKYKAVAKHKNMPSTGLAKKLDCKDLLWSTCQIKKVGIGGPLIGFDGSFIGMNFCDESGATPFLPRDQIQSIVREGIHLLERADFPPPIIIDSMPSHVWSDVFSPNTLKRKRNQWPVSKPYWSLGGQVPFVDQLVGKVPM